MTKQLDRLGQIVMQKLRDEAIEHAEGLLAKRWKAPSSRALQRELEGLSDAQKKALIRAVRAAVDTGIHNFLFALHQACDDGDMELRVGSNSVTDLSDGLHGEVFTPDGWQARFSRYGEATGDD